jgi:hypothetical protein
VKILDVKDIEFLVEFKTNYTKETIQDVFNNKYKMPSTKMLDLVKINHSATRGYEGHTGVVFGYDGCGHISIFSFSSVSHDYWMCGGFIDEDVEVIKHLTPEELLANSDSRLYGELLNYIERNDLKYMTSWMRGEYEKYKAINNIDSNIIYIDFTRG